MARLVLTNGQVLVWNPQDWEELQKKRIVGNLVGSLPNLPRQNLFHGLPMALLNEEVALILEKGFGQLKKLKASLEQIPQEVQTAHSDYTETMCSDLVRCLKEERKRHVTSVIDKIVEGRRKKLMKLKGEANYLDKEAILKEELEKADNFTGTVNYRQIFCEDPWWSDAELEDTDWLLDGSPKAQLKYQVFKDLWEKSYFVTEGVKFGGDFLAYPGSPFKFHSHFIVKCFLRDEKLTMLDLITFGRLAQTTRKTFVMAYLDAKNNVTYKSYQFVV